MTAFTIITTLVGIGLAALGIGITVALSGARARTPHLGIRVTHNVPVYGAAGPDFDRQFVAVTVANTGPAPVLVTNVGFRVDGTQQVLGGGIVPWEAPLPRWLQPTENLTWGIPTAGLRHLRDAQGIAPERLVPFAETGDGRAHTGPDRVNLR